MIIDQEADLSLGGEIKLSVRGASAANRKMASFFSRKSDLFSVQ